MKLRPSGAVVLASLVFASMGRAFDPATDIPACGIGLNGVHYYTTQWPFVDMAKIGSEWQNNDGETFDANGYPTSVNATKPFFYIYYGSGGNYPKGDIVLTWEGTGDVQLQGRTPKEQQLGGAVKRRVYAIEDTSSVGFRVQVNSTSPAPDNVRAIKLWMAGFENATSPFHPLFKERLAPFGHLRFMDWNETNSQGVVSWSTRRTPEFYSQASIGGTFSRRGVAYEHMIDLCNELDKNMWVNVPARADDDYVRQMARLIRDRLEPGLKVLVEYSNEVWNPQFGVFHWTTERAAVEGISQTQWVGRRISQIHNLFVEEFGGATRVIRVVGGANANSGWSQQVMQAARAHGTPDCVATTTYFNNDLAARIMDGSLGINYQTPTDADYQKAFDFLDRSVSTTGSTTYSRWMNFIAAANAEGLPVIAYEGGPHTNAGDYAENGALVNFLNTLNADPRVKRTYRNTLENFFALGGINHTAFVDCSAWTKWGPWGHLRYQNEPLTTAYKYQAITDWVRHHGGDRVPFLTPLKPLPNASLNLPYSATPAHVAGSGTQTWTVVAGALPGGLSLSSNGVISGRPRALGTSTFRLRLADNNGDADELTYSITVEQATTSTFIAPTHDGHVRGGTNANINYGALAEMEVKLDATDATFTRRSYLQFPLEAVPASALVSARLELTIRTAGAGTNAVSSVASDAWTEGSLTWNNSPVAGSSLGSFSTAGAGVVSLDVTAYVAAEAAGDGLASFALTSAGSSLIKFATRQTTVTGAAPRLVINAVANPAFQQSANGLVAMEAENYTAQTTGGGREWIDVQEYAGYSGRGALRADPDSGATTEAAAALTGAPKLTFPVAFTQTGTHYVWVRMAGSSIYGDSVHAGLNNQIPSTADRIQGASNSSYAWTSTTMDSGSRATINVATPGIHSFQLWMREDGARVDKIVLTTDPAYTPTGAGPGESAFQ